MALSGVARSYARALMAAAGEENILEELTTDLGQFVEFLQTSPLEAFLLSPQIPKDGKVEVITKILGDEALLGRFLKLLLRRGRMAELGGIYNSLLELEDQRQGIERVKITTAVTMSDQQKELLQKELERLLEKRIVMTNQVKPEIIGGVMVETNDYLIDGSLTKEIRDLRDRLMSARVH